MAANSNALLQGKLQALIDQLDKLNVFYQEQNDKLHNPTNIRAKETATWEAMGYATAQPKAKPHLTAKWPATDRLQPPPDLNDPAWDTQPDYGDRRTPPDSQQRTQPDQGRLRRALGNIRTYAPGAANDPHLQSGDPAEGALSVMPWLMMGEGSQGAPRFIRDIAIANYGLQQGVDWAAKSTGRLSQQISSDPTGLAGRIWNADPATGTSSRLGNVQGALGWAQANQGKMLAGYLGAQAGFRTIGKISDGLSNMKDIGQLMGYESSGGGSGFLGFNNPINLMPTNAAVQEGWAFEMEKQRLMGRIPFSGDTFGAGLTKKQATETLDVLANQGWHQNRTLSGGGNATTIAENYMRPLLQHYPGLSAQDLGQFTDQLRYAGASTTDLTNSLETMGKMASNLQLTIGGVTGSLKQYMEQTAAQGGNTLAGMRTGLNFSNVTGLAPQLGAAAAASPTVQAMGLLHSGTMPFAEAGSNTLGADTVSAVTTLASLTQGLNQSHKDQFGVMHSGLANQASFIAQQTGLPQNAVMNILQHSKQMMAGARALDVLGTDSTQNTFYNEVNAAGGMKRHSHMTAAQNQAAQQTWTKEVIPQLKAAGVDSATIKKWSNEGFRKRYYDVQGWVGKKSGDLQNTPDNGANTVTVKIQLTGAASKLFKQPPVSQAKVNINAGNIWNNNPTMNSVFANPAGDTSRFIPGTADSGPFANNTQSSPFNNG